MIKNIKVIVARRRPLYKYRGSFLTSRVCTMYATDTHTSIHERPVTKANYNSGRICKNMENQKHITFEEALIDRLEVIADALERIADALEEEDKEDD